MKTRVLLADDQALIRAGFRALVNSTDDLEVVGEATDGAEAIELSRHTRADVVLMDIRMPNVDGIAATEAITADESLASVRILILTTFELDEYVIRAIRAGASGFVGKGVEPDELLDAIRTVASGEALLSPRATRALIEQFTALPSATDPARPTQIERPEIAFLTARELEIVKLVGLGLSNEQIAEQLYISRFTAKTHVNRAMMKVAARDRAQLVVFAYQAGLIGLQPDP
jgi:DNA-binding NarL/FixJ family response regulator